MRLADCTISDVWFSHEGFDGEQRHFNITQLLESPHFPRCPVKKVALVRDDAMMIIRSRGYEPHRLQRLMELKPKPGQLDPVVFADFKRIDGTALLIDGTHRYICAALLSHGYIRGKLVPQRLWEQFLVEDVPREDMEKVRNQFSGIW